MFKCQSEKSTEDLDESNELDESNDNYGYMVAWKHHSDPSDK